jgi:hypothetical protein
MGAEQPGPPAPRRILDKRARPALPRYLHARAGAAVVRVIAVQRLGLDEFAAQCANRDRLGRRGATYAS